MKKLYLGLLLLLVLLPGQLLAACVSTIAVNDSEADVWDATCTSKNSSGSYAKYFTFTLVDEQEVTINLESAEDTYLYLLSGAGKNGTVIQENDDGGSGSGTNSQIVQTLPAGDYTIEATTYQPATTGSFVVSLLTTASGDCLSFIEPNKNVAGTWESTCTSTNRPGRYAKYYTFTVLTSQKVTIDLKSSEDSYLYLLNGAGKNGAVVAENDDGGSGDNARITRTLSAGAYTIEATTRTNATTGTFTVSINVDATPPPDECDSLIDPNSTTLGTWEAKCASTNREGRYAKYYTFTLLSRQVVTIDLESAADTYMFLLEGAGHDGKVLRENDDNGINDNSQIYMTLSAGTYTIEATTYGVAVTGNFIVRVSAELPGCDDCPFEINAGLNDAWFNSITNGQGFNITIYPIRKEVFVTWFTFDTERPADDVTAMLGGPGQRWLTAQGTFDGDTATLTIYVTEGGVFDSATPVPTTDQDGDGTMTIEFSGCNEALVTYFIASLDLSGEIPIERIVLDNVLLCEMLAES